MVIAIEECPSNTMMMTTAIPHDGLLKGTATPVIATACRSGLLRRLFGSSLGLSSSDRRDLFDF